MLCKIGVNERLVTLRSTHYRKIFLRRYSSTLRRKLTRGLYSLPPRHGRFQTRHYGYGGRGNF